MLARELDQRVEIHLHEEYVRFEREAASESRRHDTHLQQLLAVGRDRYGVGEEVALQRLAFERIYVDAESAQQSLDHGAQREERRLLRLAVPP